MFTGVPFGHPAAAVRRRLAAAPGAHASFTCLFMLFPYDSLSIHFSFTSHSLDIPLTFPYASLSVPALTRPGCLSLFVSVRLSPSLSVLMVMFFLSSLFRFLHVLQLSL